MGTARRAESVGRLGRVLRLATILLALVTPAGRAVAHTITDAQGRVVEIADTSRIVAIGASVTEILYALGVSDRIVAVDTTSTFPPAALKDKPNVGYMRALSPEGVLSLGPTLVLAMEGAGPPDAVKVLAAASVPLVTVPDARDPDEIVAKIRLIADVVGRTAEGDRIAAGVAEDFAALAQLRSRIQTPRKAVFVISAQGAAPIVGGSASSADALFRLAGVTNAMSALQGYKPAVDEAMLAAEPEAIVLMGGGPTAGVTDAALFAMPAFSRTPAARNRRVVRVDSASALGFGPRAPQAARDLAAAIYPELDLPPLPERPWTRPAGAAP